MASQSVGRPIEVRRSRTMSFYVEQTTWEMFKKIAAREGKSMSELAREILKEYAKAHGVGNEQSMITTFAKDPEYRVYPTIAMKLSREMLAAYTQKELTQIDAYLEARGREIESERRRRRD